MQLAGIIPSQQAQVDDVDLSMAHDFLNMEIDALQAEGIILRTVLRTTVALVASTAVYTLPNDTIDVFVGPDNMLGTVLVSGGNTETLVRQIRRHEYQAISNKSSTGTPTLAMVERIGAVQVTFWPVPALAYTFGYQKIRCARDVTPGSVTPDVDVRRQMALMWSLAFAMAFSKSMPLQRCSFLKDERDRLKAVARADDVERGHGQLYIAHTVS